MELKPSHVDICYFQEFQLLIVPYGIETNFAFRVCLLLPLLIVPYGIETVNSKYFGKLIRSFNCTLWN